MKLSTDPINYIRVLKRRAHKLRKKENYFKSDAHKIRANYISMMYFNGNYRSRPEKKSILDFAERDRDDSEIREFLSDLEIQKNYSI